jgi:hypothetical protein
MVEANVPLLMAFGILRLNDGGALHAAPQVFDPHRYRFKCHTRRR